MSLGGYRGLLGLDPLGPSPSPPSHLPGHRAILQNLVCFSGPSQGLPPNWGGLQVRVRSRKPRPHVLEHRLQGDHSSQAPCTAGGQEGAAEHCEPRTRVPAPGPRPDTGWPTCAHDAPPPGVLPLLLRPHSCTPQLRLSPLRCPPPASEAPPPPGCPAPPPSGPAPPRHLPGHTAELLQSRCSRRGPLHCVL